MQSTRCNDRRERIDYISLARSKSTRDDSHLEDFPSSNSLDDVTKDTIFLRTSVRALQLRKFAPHANESDEGSSPGNFTAGNSQ